MCGVLWLDDRLVSRHWASCRQGELLGQVFTPNDWKFAAGDLSWILDVMQNPDSIEIAWLEKESSGMVKKEPMPARSTHGAPHEVAANASRGGGDSAEHSPSTWWMKLMLGGGT
jgi:hypothetical protein